MYFSFTRFERTASDQIARAYTGRLSGAVYTPSTRHIVRVVHCFTHRLPDTESLFCRHVIGTRELFTPHNLTRVYNYIDKSTEMLWIFRTRHRHRGDTKPYETTGGGDALALRQKKKNRPTM